MENKHDPLRRMVPFSFDSTLIRCKGCGVQTTVGELDRLTGSTFCCCCAKDKAPETSGALSAKQTQSVGNWLALSVGDTIAVGTPHVKECD